MMQPILRVIGLRKRFGNTEVLKGIDLSVHRGETVVLVGSSGSGKSSLLRCLNLLEPPTAGLFELSGVLAGESSCLKESDLGKVRTRIGMVFQQFNLFPHLTAEENVMLGPLKVLRKSRTEARNLAVRYLEKVGLSAQAGYLPSQLSGGQQQRVGIARALAMEPEIILFDEPTSALDPEKVGEVLHTIRQLSEEGTTMVVVTHELGFAYHIADRVLFLHDGLIHEEGPPEQVLMSPLQLRTKEFLASHKLFRLPESGESFSSVSIRVAS